MKGYFLDEIVKMGCKYINVIVPLDLYADTPE
jgi:hypothetical protein